MNETITPAMKMQICSNAKWKSTMRSLAFIIVPMSGNPPLESYEAPNTQNGPPFFDRTTRNCVPNTLMFLESGGLGSKTLHWKFWFWDTVKSRNPVIQLKLFIKITFQRRQGIWTNFVSFDSLARAKHYGTYLTPFRFDAQVWGPTTKIRP